MCQVCGPTPMVACEKCGAPFYEGSFHECKVFVPFSEWDRQLQLRAQKPYSGESSLLRTIHDATRSIASWPLWMREYAWAEEFKYSLRNC
jgi:hypothetical protein